MDPGSLSSELNTLTGRLQAAQNTFYGLEERFDNPDDGSAGVREPRRPHPMAPSGSMSYA